MVFFTCNHCGESAKKGAVEKHYQTKCRGAPIFVSCMDCLKDFRDQEYVEHTKCITEAEKYSGKGYVPKESLNKGQKKQDSWLEIVRSILTSPEYNLKQPVKVVFQRLQSYDNVPRRGSKFENFVSNSMRIDKKQAKEVWNILEKELNKLKSKNSNATKTNSNDEISNGHTENEDLTKSNGHTENEDLTKSNGQIENGDVNESKETNGKKSKKAKKRDLESNNNEAINTIEQKENQEEPKKKKKKTKSETETTTETIVEETDVATNDIIKAVVTNGKSNKKDDVTFSWFDVISECAKDGLTLEKLKKKVIKKHKLIIGHDESTNLNKLDKTFKKYLKKSGITIDNDIIKING